MGAKVDWEAEIDSRIFDLDSGAVEPVSLEEAFRRLDSTLE